MHNDHVTIRSTAVFDLIGPPEPTGARSGRAPLRHPRPLRRQAAFRTGRAGWVEWVFSRDLLTEGLIDAAGDGDVRIRPAEGEAVEIELSSPSGHATFRALAREVLGVPPADPRGHRAGLEDDWLDLEHALGLLLSTDPS